MKVAIVESYFEGIDENLKDFIDDDNETHCDRKNKLLKCTS